MPGVRRLLLQLRSKSWYNFKYMDFSTGKIDGMKQSTGGSCEDISSDWRGVIMAQLSRQKFDVFIMN